MKQLEIKDLVFCTIRGGLDINAELVRLGAAWVYDKYATDESLYVLQQEAVNEGRGLWRQPHPVTPWEWRHNH